MKKVRGKGAAEWSRRRKVVSGVAAGIVVLVTACLIAWTAVKSHDTDINQGGYQAVFLTNGQVYFGKLEPFTMGTMRLTHVFYLQKSDSNESANPQASGSTGDVQLIKLGSEIHGPQDEMVIQRQQILYYENLKPDGNVAQTIAKYKP